MNNRKLDQGELKNSRTGSKKIHRTEGHILDQLEQQNSLTYGR